MSRVYIHTMPTVSPRPRELVTRAKGAGHPRGQGGWLSRPRAARAAALSSSSQPFTLPPKTTTAAQTHAST